MKSLFCFTLGFFLCQFAHGQVITPTDGNWASKDTVMANTPEGELMVRTGDIDNMGFGWPSGFDPFSGQNTPAHSFPWNASPEDPAGTDRIMVISSYNGAAPAGTDGYTSTTSRPANQVSAVSLDYTFSGTLTHAVIYAFLDDFQAPVWQANYQVTLDSIRIPLYESVVNALIQTGPIGKIVKLPIPHNLLYLLADGQLKIRFDDYTTGAGDGFAIDFVKLVINPINTSGTCVLKGKVTDFFSSGAPIPNVKVMANGLDSAMTDALGNYRISGVDPGIILIQTYKAGYGAEVASLVLAENDSVSKDFQLKTGAPQLTYNSPEQGATQVSLQSKIKMVFSQTINASTFNTFSFTLTDGQNPVSGQCQSNSDTLLFIPEALEMGKTYTATVTTSLKSMAGVPLDRNYSFQFQTLTPLKVNPEIQQKGMQVFPNPGAGNLVVSGVKEQDLLEITGMDGRVYFSEKGKASPIEIPASVLKPGLYMVKRKGLKEQETIRFIRN